MQMLEETANLFHGKEKKEKTSKARIDQPKENKSSTDAMLEGTAKFWHNEAKFKKP